MTRPVALALSPHLDDAVFSCGGTLARLALSGWYVIVATLFTRSVPDPDGFALACQLDKGLGPEVDYMALRRSEDAGAMQALGATAEWLPFAEAPHRGYGSADALFAPPRTGDVIVPALGEAISRVVARFHPDLVLAPQAVGGHVDHVQAVRAIDAAALPVPIAWWRDFPYAVRTVRPKEPFEARFVQLSEREIVLGTAAAEAKTAACLAYASQLGFQFGGAVELGRKLRETGGVERFRGAAPE